MCGLSMIIYLVMEGLRDVIDASSDKELVSQHVFRERSHLLGHTDVRNKRQSCLALPSSFENLLQEGASFSDSITSAACVPVSGIGLGHLC